MIFSRKVKYIFTTPYQRDTRLIAVPLYSTTHIDTYSTPVNYKYSNVTSRYKQDAPFTKLNKNVNKNMNKNMNHYVKIKYNYVS
jgi:hypothetical protein